MQYLETSEGGFALLKTRTQKRPFFFQSDLLHGNRKTPWVYLCQNPNGRWLVLIPHPSEPKEFYCIAGAKQIETVIPAFVQAAVALGILKRGGRRGNPPATRRVLWALDSFVSIAKFHAERERK